MGNDAASIIVCPSCAARYLRRTYSTIQCKKCNAALPTGDAFMDGTLWATSQAANDTIGSDTRPQTRKSMAVNLGEGTHSLSLKPSKGKGSGKAAAALAPTSTADAAPASTSAETSRLSAEVPRTKEQARHILAIQEKLDEIK